VASYPRGTTIYLRGLYWGAAVAVAVNASTDRLVTLAPHGLIAAAPIFFQSGSVPGNIANLNGYGEPALFYVVNPTATAFQVAATVGGTPINIDGSAAGVAYVLGDPTDAICTVTPPGGAPVPYLFSLAQIVKEAVGTYGLSYVVPNTVGDYRYVYSGTGGMVVVGSGTFTAV
jgi:hypothetical protein